MLQLPFVNRLDILNRHALLTAMRAVKLLATAVNRLAVAAVRQKFQNM